MKRVLIGHRGVGKTSLLKRHAEYFSEIKHFDLDLEIEKSISTNISEFFAKFGEVVFRKKEQEIFKKLLADNKDFVVSLGAGFDLSILPKDIDVLYVSRITDADGHIFLNRPRLEPGSGPLEESLKLFKLRSPQYRKAASKIYHMPEGVDSVNDIEKNILSNTFEVSDAYYTLSVQDLPQLAVLLRCYKKIELRTDLLSMEVITDLLSQYPDHQWLVSIRTYTSIDYKNIDVDYKYYFAGCQILSSHIDQIDEAISQLSQISEKLHLKISPLVENFQDLIKGYNWQQEDANNRSFLPRSRTGKWVWFRQLCKYNQKINFIRNFTEIADQPSLFEWLCLPIEKPISWGAVLGKPIYFSRSPVKHQKYFFQKKTFFTRIEISPEEMKKYIYFFINLGMHYASVTSPLKAVAFELSEARSEEATQFTSVNTLYIKNKKIFGHNTDLVGFKKLVEGIKSTDTVAVWGGGGTLTMMKSVLPQAQFYSSRSGEPREIQIEALSAYDYLIWAAPRSVSTKSPRDLFRAKKLIDLNYTENSMGLEFAANRKIDYISGIAMFNAQADAQQEFWLTNKL